MHEMKTYGCVALLVLAAAAGLEAVQGLSKSGKHMRMHA